MYVYVASKRLMGDMATLRLARQELEDLYMGVPDYSVDLTFKDLASSSSLPAKTPTTTGKLLSVVDEADHQDADERSNGKQTTTGGGGGALALARSSTNIFTYRPLEHHDDAAAGGGTLLLQLPSSPAAPPTPRRHNDDDDDDGRQYHAAAAGTTTTTGEAAALGGGRRTRRSHVADDAAAGGRHQRRAAHGSSNYRRPGIPHSNICALCNTYVYLFRHRCLVCGRVYCRRCVGAGMGDMTEGRKCVDCLGRRYSHRYIHRAGDTGGGFCCFWGYGYYPNAKAVTAQELICAEKGPAPRRRPRPAGGSSSSSYGGGGYYSSTNTFNSASMSMTMNNSDSSIATMKMMNASISGMPASASSSFVASFPHNPHALPL